MPIARRPLPRPLANAASAAVLISMTAGAASAQPGLVASPRANAGLEANSFVDVIRDKLQPRTYQARIPEADLRPAGILVPPAAVSAPQGGVTPVVIFDEPITMQYRIPAADLSGIPIGTPIDRLAVRVAVQNIVWPAAGPFLLNNYEITLSRDANPTGALSPTFSANQLSPVRVRRGPLVIPPGGMNSGPGSPTAFGRDIVFDRPYTYTGGNLIITITHDGAGAANGGFLDVDSVVRPGGAIVGAGFRAAAGSPAIVTPVLRLGTPRVPVGAEILGLRWRHDQNGPGPRPDQNIPFAEFSVRLAEDARAGQPLLAAFASNELRPVTVRSGAYTMPAGLFPSGSPVAPFSLASPGQFIRPFVYTGGGLIYTLTHPGTDISPFVRFDASNSGEARMATTFNAASGTAAPAAVVNPEYCPTGAVPAPNAVANAMSTGHSAGYLTDRNPRTFQIQIAASELTGITPGDIITELNFDPLYYQDDAAWPDEDLVCPNFDIFLAEAAFPIGSMSVNFDANQVNPAHVRTGPMAYPRNLLSRDVRWQWRIPIAPYQYNGGDLVITIRHRGQIWTPINDGGYLFTGVPTNTPGIRHLRAFGEFQTTGAFGHAPLIRLRTRTPLRPGILFENEQPGRRAFAHATGEDLVPGSTQGNIAYRTTLLGPTLVQSASLEDPRGSRVTGVTFFPHYPGTTAETDFPVPTSIRIMRDVNGRPDPLPIADVMGISIATFDRAYAFQQSGTDYPLRRVRIDFPTPRPLPPGRYWIEFGAGSIGQSDAWLAASLDPCGRTIPGDALMGFAPTFFPTPIPVRFPMEVHGASMACKADADANGEIDLADFFLFLNAFDTSDPGADVTMDFTVDLADFFEFLNAFDQGC